MKFLAIQESINVIYNFQINKFYYIKYIDLFTARWKIGNCHRITHGLVNITARKILCDITGSLWWVWENKRDYNENYLIIYVAGSESKTEPFNFVLPWIVLYISPVFFFLRLCLKTHICSHRVYRYSNHLLSLLVTLKFRKILEIFRRIVIISGLKLIEPLGEEGGKKKWKLQRGKNHNTAKYRLWCEYIRKHWGTSPLHVPFPTQVKTAGKESSYPGEQT